MSASDEIQRGKDSYARRAWAEAHASLAAADQADPLAPEDLERLADSAYLLGRDAEHASVMERAHHAHLTEGHALRAARCAFWVGLNLALRGEIGPATGWFGRAQRIIDREDCDCSERGYLLIPVLFQQLAAGDYEAAHQTAAAAAAIADRFGERDLLAIAVHEQGHALLEQGQVEEGLRLLDEAMVAVTSDECSPIVTGLVYCSVIGYCQDAFALRRAQQWTDAMAGWCDKQPDLVAFTGRCLVDRAQILQLRGAWAEALEEARRAAGRGIAQTMSRLVTAEAFYRQGEIHRLRGELESAEEAYRDASRGGWEPQPGLALLRLSQKKPDAAAAAIRRVVAAATKPRERAPLLSACVEIMLAVGDVEEADGACRELAEIAADNGSRLLGAMAAHAQGAVRLARGDAHAALLCLRQACEAWHELEAPYDLARARVLVGLACRSLGDEDAVALELEAACSAFEELGAAPDVARIEALRRSAAGAETHGLTGRELEVLRLVAAGMSNRAIAAALFISEHTVARHLQNIFGKLGVSSRTAAIALANKKKLL